MFGRLSDRYEEPSRSLLLLFFTEVKAPMPRFLRSNTDSIHNLIDSPNRAGVQEMIRPCQKSTNGAENDDAEEEEDIMGKYAQKPSKHAAAVLDEADPEHWRQRRLQVRRREFEPSDRRVRL